MSHVFSDCFSKPADIHFLLDNSGSLEERKFVEQLDFVIRFIKEFNIDPDYVRVGVSVYGSVVKHKFWMNMYMDEKSLIGEINAMKKQYSSSK